MKKRPKLPGAHSSAPVFASFTEAEESGSWAPLRTQCCPLAAK